MVHTRGTGCVGEKRKPIRLRLTAGNEVRNEQSYWEQSFDSLTTVVSDVGDQLTLLRQQRHIIYQDVIFPTTLAAEVNLKWTYAHAFSSRRTSGTLREWSYALYWISGQIFCPTWVFGARVMCLCQFVWTVSVGSRFIVKGRWWWYSPCVLDVPVLRTLPTLLTCLSFPASVRSETKVSDVFSKSLKSLVGRHSPFDLGSLYVLGFLWVPAGRSLPEDKQKRNHFSLQIQQLRVSHILALLPSFSGFGT